MEDEKTRELYWNRSEDAVVETEKNSDITVTCLTNWSIGDRLLVSRKSIVNRPKEKGYG